MRAHLALAALAVVCACGGSGSGHTSPLSSSWQGPDALAYVPADTPYLLMAIDSGADTVDDLAFTGLGSGATTWMKDLPAPTTPIEKLAYATLQQLAGKTRAQIYQQLGVAEHGHVLIYGMGLAPVARLPLADPKPLRDLVSQALVASGNAGTPDPAAGPTAWTFSDDKFGIGLAITDHEVVGVVSSSEHVAALLASAVHDKAQNPLRSDDVVALANKFGITTAYIAEIDWQRAVAALEKQTKMEPPFQLLLPQECHADAEFLAKLSPHTVFGYSRADAHAFDASIYFELAPEIAKGLDSLRVAMPAPHPASPSSLGTFEAAINLEAATAWVRTALAVAAARPMTCPALAEVNDLIGKMRDTLAQPLPEEIRGLRGVQLVVDDASVSPPNGVGYALGAGAQLAPALAQLQQMMPGLALVPGKPVQIPTASLGMGTIQAYVGVGPDRAVLAVGPDSSNRVSGELSAPARERAPLMEVTMDIDALRKKIPSFDLGASSGTAAQFKSETMAIDVRASSLVLDVRGTLR